MCRRILPEYYVYLSHSDSSSAPSQGLIVLLLADEGSCRWGAGAAPPPCGNGNGLALPAPPAMSAAIQSLTLSPLARDAVPRARSALSACCPSPLTSACLEGMAAGAGVMTPTRAGSRPLPGKAPGAPPSRRAARDHALATEGAAGLTGLAGASSTTPEAARVPVGAAWVKVARL